MHFTTAILVHVPSAVDDDENNIKEMTKEELTACVVNYAENETERFYGPVYDYRDLIENPVIFANENWKAFEDDLLERDRAQKGYAISMLEYLSELTDKRDITDLVSSLFLANDRRATPESVDIKTWKWDHLDQRSWALLEIARVIKGKFTAESGFYDTYRRTSLVPFIEKLKEEPDNWALVTYDCHW